jgi:hypothetical protein
MKIAGLLALVGTFAGLSTGILTRPTIIVAKKQFVSQTGSIAETTLFTPPHDGDFRISLYASSPFCSAVGVTGVDTQIGWTDTIVPSPWLLSISQLQCGQFGGRIYNQGTLVVHAKGGTPINVQVQYGATAGEYSLYITVEILQ